MSKVLAAVEQIVALLIRAKREYYNSDESFLTDEEFDQLENQLKELDPDNDYFSLVGTPIEKKLEKVKLPVKMSGLDQMDQDEIFKWVSNSNTTNDDYVVVDKLDGVSVLIEYKDGKYNKAYSRGNGIEGADVTRHLKQMNIPKTITTEDKILYIRGEILFKEDLFNKLNDSGQLGRIYKNSRNYTAGQMNRKVADQIFLDNVSVVCYSIFRESE